MSGIGEVMKRAIIFTVLILRFAIAAVTLVSGIAAMLMIIWHNGHNMNMLLKIFLSGVTLLTSFNIVKIWWKGL